MANLLNEAVEAIQAGDKARGRSLLVKFLQTEPQNELAWMWMTTVAATAQEHRYCLDKILEINPGNVKAREQLARTAQAPAPIAQPAPTVPPAPPAAPTPHRVSSASSGSPSAGSPHPPRAVPVPEDKAFHSQRPGLDLGRLLRGPLGFWSVIVLVAAGAVFFLRGPRPDESADVAGAAPGTEPGAVSVDAREDAKARAARDKKVVRAGGVIETATPGPIVDAIVAGGGSRLVLRIEASPSLTIYDADSQELARTLRLPSSNFLYTAGDQTVLVYFPENNLFQTWDLGTGQKLKSKLNSMGATVTCMTMGHSNGGFAWIRWAEGTDALDRAGSYLLDTTSLEMVEPYESEGGRRGHNSSYRDRVHQRADGQMRLVSEWATSHSPTGLGLFVLSSEGWQTRYEHDTVGTILVGDDGLLYTQEGTIYNSQLTKVATIAGRKLIPAIGGRFFLGVGGDGSMQVYSSGTTSPVTVLGTFPGLQPGDRSFSHPASMRAGFTLDRHVVLDPRNRRILLIPLTHEKVIYRYFDLEESLEDLGLDYLVVTSSPETVLRAGETWAYEIEVLTNARKYEVSLESAPDGMEIQNKRKLVWMPHPTFEGTEHVVVLIQASNGESTYHNLELTVK